MKTTGQPVPQLQNQSRAKLQTMHSVEELIATHPFFAGINLDFLPILNECASLRRFAANQQIFRESGAADHFYLLLSGCVAIGTSVPGSGMVRIQVLGPGEPLGWSWLFPPFEWHFSAVTLKPTEVISFAATALREKAEQNCEFRADLLARVAQTLVERLQDTRMKLAQSCAWHLQGRPLSTKGSNVL